MVALKRQPEQRHWECGPVHQEVPLRVYAEPEQSKPIPWWVELSLALAFIGVIGLAFYGAVAVAVF